MDLINFVMKYSRVKTKALISFKHITHLSTSNPPSPFSFPLLPSPPSFLPLLSFSPRSPLDSISRLQPVEYQCCLDWLVSLINVLCRRHGDQHQGNQECSHTEEYLQRKRCLTGYPSRRLEADLVNGLVTFALSV